MADIATKATVRATSADVPLLSRTLARAFHDDPVFSWIVPDATRRRALLPPTFAAFAEVYLSHEQTYLAGGGAGAALWAPAGVAPMSEQQAQWFGQRLVETLGVDADRAFELNDLFEQHHPEQPCFYLQLLGVVPERQGGGLGSGLLATVLRRCDATGIPAYLEATSPDNRRLYEQHGFDTVAEIVLPDGPPAWPMWREPGVAEGESPSRAGR